MTQEPETDTTKVASNVSKSGWAACYVVEIGGFNDTPDTTRVFSTYEKAIEILPYGFEEQRGYDYIFYAVNDDKEQWFTITKYNVE